MGLSVPQFLSVSTALELHEERHGINLHQPCRPILCAGKGAPRSEQIGSAPQLWEDGVLDLLCSWGPTFSLGGLGLPSLRNSLGEAVVQPELKVTGFGGLLGSAEAHLG